MNKPVNNDPPLGRASQGRRDALSGRWVILAPGRSARPAEMRETELPTPTGHACPFCAGNESFTPPATYAIHDSREQATPWTVRVVPNLFPAVSSKNGEIMVGFDDRRFPLSEDWQDVDQDVEGLLLHRRRSSTEQKYFGNASFHHLIADAEPNFPVTQHTDRPWETLAEHQRHHVSTLDKALFEFCELHGGHEVIIESPNHVESLTSLPAAHAAKVFETYAERIRHWSVQPGVQYVVVFKNVGAAAGASLRHTHSQLIATNLLPPAMQEIGQRMQRYHQQGGGCLLCDMLAGELNDQWRIVATTERFIAYCPFASRLPYLVRIAPKNHCDQFETSCDESLSELAGLTQSVLRSLESMFVACAYNYTIHTRPPAVACQQSYHWWMEIFPRLTKVAGFEWGSGCYINPVTPENAAEHLRAEF